MPDEAPVTPATLVVVESTPQPDQIAERDNRIRELEGQLATANETVAEMRQYATVIGQLRVTLGEEADIAAVVTEMHGVMELLRERLNTAGSVSLSMALEEWFTQAEAAQTSLGEMRSAAFERSVDDQIAEMTRWNANTDNSKKQLAAFRANFKRAALGELADRDPAKIKETLTRLWDGEYKPLAEGLLKAMAGPSAFVGGNGESAGKRYPSNDELAAMGTRYVPGKG